MHGPALAARPGHSAAMSWVVVIWSMVAGACLVLASLHLSVWLKDRSAWPNLLFSVFAMAAAAYVLLELRILYARTPEELAAARRWANVPVWVLVASLAAFVYTFLDAGRLWLAGAAIGARTLALPLDFATGQDQQLLGQLSIVFLAAFVADAIRTAWRRDDGSNAIWLGGGVPFQVQADTTRKPVHWRSAFPDITAGKQSEQETDLLRQELARVGRVSVMGQLASSLAHEINQPLGAILRNTEAAKILILESSPDIEEIAAILDDIEADDQRAACSRPAEWRGNPLHPPALHESAVACGGS